ncbi:MAG TPA: enterotoxin [Thermoanaerobaculia bacterium]
MGGPDRTLLSRREFARQSFAGIGLGLAAGRRISAAIPERRSTVAGRVRGDKLSLENEAIAASWSAGPAGLRLESLEDRRNGVLLPVRRGTFALALDGGVLLDSAAMLLAEPPRVEEIRSDPGAARAAQRLPGTRIRAALTDPERRLEVRWSAELRDGSHYLRQEVAVTARGDDLPLREIVLVDLEAPGAFVSGTVAGSPIVAGSWFFAVEHPLAQSVAGRRARASLSRPLPLRAGRTASVSAVFGAAREGQLRRDFLAYVERERARPYAPFLHYNSWYDLGYFTRFDEASALGVIDAFGGELHEKRGVVLDSFLFDDGWDDRRFWGFHEGFPRGFAPLRDAAARYGAAPGVWLSPWGGYGKPREERLAYAKAQGFETNEDGLALSGPVYYRRFREVCLEFVRKYGVNQFKIDGTGSSSHVVPGSAFGSDFEAAIALIGDLRAEKPGLFVNLTTGTYPSPFWLFHADSIWRGGEDHDFAGEGSDRQRWITYRDADTYAGVVQRGPLYPLNSLMLHGLIYARHAKRLDADPRGDFGAEIRSYFGSGTQLQEMYVTAALLGPEEWDAIAEAAKWSRGNAATLVDTRWVGGDPARLEPYGWAAWSREKAVLTLRNPSGRPQEFVADAAAIWEPGNASAGRFSLTSPWKKDRDRPSLVLETGKRRIVTLAPYEVATYEAAI